MKAIAMVVAVATLTAWSAPVKPVGIAKKSYKSALQRVSFMHPSNLKVRYDPPDDPDGVIVLYDPKDQEETQLAVVSANWKRQMFKVATDVGFIQKGSRWYAEGLKGHLSPAEEFRVGSYRGLRGAPRIMIYSKKGPWGPAEEHHVLLTDGRRTAVIIGHPYLSPVALELIVSSLVFVN